jgi:hypothetical protein
MKLKKYLTKDKNDGFTEKIKEVSDIVLGKNTFLFFENPLVEGSYYPVNEPLTEDEISHFSMLTEMLNEAKKKSQKELDDEEAERTSQLRKLDSMSARLKQDDASRKKDQKYEEEVKKAYQDLNKKSRKAYQNVEDLGKKSFIAKYILHGADVRRKGKSGEAWGRIGVGKDQTITKEVYSDRLKSFKERQKFANDVIKMARQQSIENKQAEQKINALTKSFTSLPDLEAHLGSIKDGYTERLFRYAQDAFNAEWFTAERYAEFLFKIYGKQYNNLSELKKCIKQFSAIQANDKTGMSVDISTVCPKREKLLDMLREWERATADVEKAAADGASDSTLATLRDRADKLKPTEASNPTCNYCYVESGRDMLKINPNWIHAKEEKRGMQYQGEFSRMKKDKIAQLNKMGGLRFFGSGDYIEDSATDKQIERIIDDAEKVGLQLKAITKQERFVKKYGGRLFTSGPLKGKPVFNINMSVDPQRGFNLTNAISIKKSYPGNVNIRVVAMNPKEAIEYSKEKEVDVITLLHFGVRPVRMSNKDLYVNMSPNTKGWKDAIAGMKKAHPKANWAKVLSKLCCTNGHCSKCPNACGFNPRRVADFTQLAKGGKIQVKGKATVTL